MLLGITQKLTKLTIFNQLFSTLADPDKRVDRSSTVIAKDPEGKVLQAEEKSVLFFEYERGQLDACDEKMRRACLQLFI
jgi:hypothetical protein